MKIDHQLAERWIKPNAKVLDLGCGNGDLLAHLQSTKLKSMTALPKASTSLSKT